MCEPTTIIAAAGLVMGAYGSYQQAQGQKQSLMYQSQVAQNNATTAENNAKVLEIQAQDAERRGQQDLINARRENDRLKGAQRVSLAARGLDLNEGTPLSLQEQTDFFGQVDQVNIKNNTAKDAWRIRVGAQNEMNNASGLRADSGMLSSKSNSVSPGMAAATTLIGGAGSVADKWYKYGSKPAAPSTKLSNSWDIPMQPGGGY